MGAVARGERHDVLTTDGTLIGHRQLAEAELITSSLSP